MTKDTPRELRIDIETFSGRKVYAMYSEFNISSESEKYKLHLAGYTGDAGEGLLFEYDLPTHNGKPFSTFDADYDRRKGCCACECGGGWWYGDCFLSNLNGKYYAERPPGYQGILWYTIVEYNRSLKFVQMSIR
ncbi:hypothetical protein DPMN_185715 [Dreissena polymorpha]|uniref:Fibrinogen C-terminal domain-containing protein n=1 Tax=Dreissena polymorpha TaxID=45954 RepID=A0A9D4I5U6_DREPO|nr:hypothetical protein DPMN_185715 [Dreissena polymorpha]